jgi:hypothetical protein
MNVANSHIRMHSKCIKILEMIQTVNKRIVSAKADLIRYDCADGLSPLRIMYDRSDLEKLLEHHRSVRDRIVVYYAENMLKLIEASLIVNQ